MSDPMLPFDETRQEQIFANFKKYHRRNPQIFERFCGLSLQIIASGREEWGAQAVMEVLRWHDAIETEGEPVKINRNYCPYYARLFEVRYPEHVGFFRKRKLTSAEKEGYPVNLTMVHGESPEEAIERGLEDRLRDLLDGDGEEE